MLERDSVVTQGESQGYSSECFRPLDKSKLQTLDNRLQSMTFVLASTFCLLR